jgi:porin
MKNLSPFRRLLLILLLLGPQTVLAQTWEVENGIPQPSIATSLPKNGDPMGLRKWLGDHGVVYQMIYTNDTLSNVSGGLRRGTINQGKLETIVAVDLAKLAGWDGLRFYANSFQIHNTGRMRRDYVGGVNTIAAIEAVPTSRLSELWLEQKFMSGMMSFRFGQLAADSEFFFTDASTLFLDSDWATITALNLPSGGAAYPLSTPGVRLKFEPNKDASFLVAVLNGDPAGPGPGDEQMRNMYGLNFRVKDPAFIIGEAQFRRNQGKTDTGLASTYKLGAWAHLGEFNDQRFTTNGGLLADPNSSGIPARRRGNSGVYLAFDQQLYRPKGAEPNKGITAFGRVSSSPSDRNLISFYADGGIVFAGLVPGRPDDAFGATVLYARYSDSVRAFDRDNVILNGRLGPLRDYETNLEITYQAQIVPGWTVQPTAEWVWHPSQSLANAPPPRTANVYGIRSIWRY